MPNMNMRLLKLIIRKANLAYKNQIDDKHEPDFRVTLCLEASKYFNCATKELSFFDYYKNEGRVKRDSIFGSFLSIILGNIPSVYKDNNAKKGQLIFSHEDFEFYEKSSRSIPYRNELGENYLSSFYNKY